MSYTPYAIGLSTLSQVAGDMASTKAFKAQAEAQTSANILNAKSVTSNFEYLAQKNLENINAINETLAGKLSERRLTAIKEYATLKTAAAETGTSGGTTDVAINEAFVNSEMDSAVLKSQYNSQIKALLGDTEVAANQARQQTDAILSGGLTVNTSPFASAIAGGLNVANSSLSLMTDAERVKALGIKQ